jgi:ribosome-binding factor A
MKFFLIAKYPKGTPTESSCFPIMSIRTERVAGEVQQALAHALQTDFSSLTDSLITITKVRMAPDLRSARVYVSLLGGIASPQKTIEKIKEEAPHLRAAVARAIRLRYVPELFFYLDDTQQEVAHIEEIFKKIGESRPPAQEAIQE